MSKKKKKKKKQKNLSLFFLTNIGNVSNKSFFTYLSNLLPYYQNKVTFKWMDNMDILKYYTRRYKREKKRKKQTWEYKLSVFVPIVVNIFLATLLLEGWRNQSNARAKTMTLQNINLNKFNATLYTKLQRKYQTSLQNGNIAGKGKLVIEENHGGVT